MTRLGIKSQPPGPLVNTQLVRPITVVKNDLSINKFHIIVTILAGLLINTKLRLKLQY